VAHPDPVAAPSEAADPAASDAGVRLRWHRRVRERARANRAADLVWRASVLGLGSAVIVAGLIMLVVPGPGWAAIFVGLAILASEYAWAHNLLSRAKEWAQRARDRATDPAVRRRNLALTSLAAVAVLAVGAWYLVEYGPTLDGPRDWFASVG
jgi:uncharacterized protein (TIGR02611 family)